MWYKNVRAQNILILALSFIGLIGSVYVFTLNWELSTKERNQIEEEVFSSLVDYLTYHPKVEIDYLFIGTSGSDPSPDILNSFKNHIPTVDPISSSRKSFGFSAPVVHKADVNKRGIQINLESLKRESNGDVNVRTVIYKDRAASATYIFTLRKYDGVYRVNHVTFPDQGIF